MSTARGSRNGDQNGGRGYSDSVLVTALRLITPAGVLAILAVAFQINSNLDRNCDATKAVSIVTLGLVSADSDVAPTEARRLREFLRDNVPSCTSTVVP